ncbi:MAG: hypothetical protein AMXMBFR48_27040 [Ignavibacteriales bacterium]
MGVFTDEHSRRELQDKLNLALRENFRKKSLLPASETGFIKLTIPDMPNSKKQKYRLTAKGQKLGK